jgi:Kef-type K+ transport system membrane component KefB
MSRIVERKSAVNEQPGNKFGEWGERVAKYVPAEVLSFYLPANATIDAAAPADANARIGCYIFIFILGLVCTTAFLFKAARPQRPPMVQLIISSIAFVLWAYYLGGVFTMLGWHNNLIAAIALGSFTLVAGLVEP